VAECQSGYKQMENSGWIYLRVHKDEAYCFGKTDNPDRRDSEYRKENPFIKKVYDFFVADMVAVESELIQRTASLRLFPNSKEWIRFCDEARQIVDEVRKQYALMTHDQWQRVISDEAGKRREDEERRQAFLMQLKQDSERLRDAERQVERQRLEAELRREACIKAENEWRHKEYKSRMNVFQEKLCTRCQVPATYDVVATGYRCPRCKSRCV
jgi:hypothetical protein